MELINKIALNVDTAITEAARRYPRVYLGLSYLGDPCARKVFYEWRFARFELPTPRVLRIFDRGDREEERFVNWLRSAGYSVLANDPETGQQFAYSLFEDHVRGHADGFIFINGEKLLLEIKTHNNRSFSAVKRAKNIRVSKPVHFTQMQSYIKQEKKVSRGLYCAINKDNDALHFEIVEQHKETMDWLDERAVGLLNAQRIPDKISVDSEFWLCKMCKYRGPCFFNEPVNRTCRLCCNAELGKKGSWICTLKSKQLTLNEQLVGCRKIEPL